MSSVKDQQHFWEYSFDKFASHLLSQICMTFYTMLLNFIHCVPSSLCANLSIRYFIIQMNNYIRLPDPPMLYLFIISYSYSYLEHSILLWLNLKNSVLYSNLCLSPLWFEPSSGHMWESQVLLMDGQVVFLRVLRFSPTFDERSARYKWNILERALKPKSKKKKKKIVSAG